MKTLQDYIDKLNALNFKDMYENDFFLTWDKTDDEMEAIWVLADALRFMREHNISTKIFESGLGISIFRDNSTRTRFSFASACNLLGLQVQDLDEKKSQIAHGETVRETANMISFMADVIGIRDRVIKTASSNRSRLWSTSSATSTIQPSVWPTRPISSMKWAAWKT